MSTNFRNEFFPIHNLLINCPQFVLTWNTNPQFVKRPQFVLLVSTIFRKRLHILWTFHNLCDFGPKTSLKYPKFSPAALKKPFEYIHRGSKIKKFARLRRAESNSKILSWTQRPHEMRYFKTFEISTSRGYMLQNFNLNCNRPNRIHMMTYRFFRYENNTFRNYC